MKARLAVARAEPWRHLLLRLKIQKAKLLTFREDLKARPAAGSRLAVAHAEPCRQLLLRLKSRRQKLLTFREGFQARSGSGCGWNARPPNSTVSRAAMIRAFP